MSRGEEADVLIVGGGPVGLAMAAELSYRGVNTILLEKRPTTSDSPKAVALSARSMEHFRRLGLQEKIQDASYPHDLPVNLIFSTGAYRGHSIYRKKFAAWGQIGVKGTDFPFFQYGASITPPMLCPQFTSEAVIRKHVEDTSKCVQMLWGWSMKSLSQDDSGVTVKATNQDGKDKIFRAKYLVGCDGGSSFTRKELGLHTYGSFVLARACTIWFSSPQFMEHMKKVDTTGFAFTVNNNINSLMILLNRKGEYALHVFLPASASDKEVQKHVQNPKMCIESALGDSDLPVEVKSVSGYNMHALVSTKFRVGRCFLAGDSAHQWLPAGGLGLNTGLSDVADLAWKLEAVVKGYGGENLLDSFEIERRPLVDSTRRFAMSFGEVLIAFDSRAMMKLREMMMSNPLTRYVLGKAIGRTLPRQFMEGMDLVLGFQYSNSNIILHQYNPDGKIRLHCNEECKYIPSSLPGCRAPHVTLPECASILDLFGKSFVLLIIGGVESDLKELKGVMTERKVPFSTHAYPPLPELTSLYDRKYFLIRPDGVVAWRSDFQPSIAESAKVISTVLGHVSNSRLPPPISTYLEPAAPVYRGFIRDLVIRFSIAEILYYSTEISFLTAGIIGFGTFVLLRAASVAPPPRKTESMSRHKAAVITKYGNANNVLKILPKHIGKFGMDDVLIRVHASSVTEFDLFMRKGHGWNTYQRLAKLEVGGQYFPLVLGRECSGEVVAVGDNVSKFLPGDQVYAAVPPHRQGCHAQLVAVNKHHAAFKPSNIDHKEAASLPWAATTAWTALVTHAGINCSNARGRKVLVLRGTSGVGSFAVQMLKAWGAQVTTTCPTENMALAHHLGADKVVDDKTGDFTSVLSGYDAVLDTLGGKYERPSLSTLKYYRGSVYVSCVSPREKLVDSLGGFLGELVFSSLYRCKVFFNRLFGGRGFYYSSTEVGGAALSEVRALVEQGAVRPLIDAIYSLDEIVDAHKHVETGQTRGKVVVSVP